LVFHVDEGKTENLVRMAICLEFPAVEGEQKRTPTRTGWLASYLELFKAEGEDGNA